MKKIIHILVIILSVCSLQAQSERDKEFVSCMARKSLLEVKLGELSQSNALGVEVKDLGRHMIEDHTKANAELKILADRKSISFPTTLNKKQQKIYDKMSKLKGDAFDKRYTKCLEKSHKKTKCEMKKEVKKGKDVDIAAWAQTYLPVIQHHQDMTKAACKSIKK